MDLNEGERLVAVARHERGLGVFRQKPSVWLMGVAGLFGYHFFYFTARGAAPSAPIWRRFPLWMHLSVE